MKINPSTWIKNIVVKYNYSMDISKARATSSAYAFLFLRNPSPFKWVFDKYKHFFKALGLFENSDARERFVKALLTTNPYPQQCSFCKSLFKEKLQHQLRDCKYLQLERMILTTELSLYRGHETKKISLNDLH